MTTLIKSMISNLVAPINKTEIEGSPEQLKNAGQLSKLYVKREKGLHPIRYVLDRKGFERKALDKYNRDHVHSVDTHVGSALSEKNKTGADSGSPNTVSRNVNSEISRQPKALRRSIALDTSNSDGTNINTENENESKENKVDRLAEKQATNIESGTQPTVEEETAAKARSAIAKTGQHGASLESQETENAPKPKPRKKMRSAASGHSQLNVTLSQSAKVDNSVIPHKADTDAELHAYVSNAVNNSIVFGTAPVVRTTEEQVHHSYNQLVSFAQDALFGVREAKGEEAAKVVVNTLLVKQYRNNGENPETGGASFVEENDKLDFSRITLSLTGNTDEEQKASKSFDQFNIECIKIRHILGKHWHGKGKEYVDKNGSDIFSQIVDKNTDNFLNDYIDEIKKVYKLKIESAQESKTETGLTLKTDFAVSSQEVPISTTAQVVDKEAKQKMLRDYYKIVIDSQPKVDKEAMLFLARAFLYAEGVATVVDDDGIKDFNKLYIASDLPITGEGEKKGLRDAIVSAKNMMRSYIKSQNNTTISGLENPNKFGKSIKNGLLASKVDDNTNLQIVEAFYKLVQKNVKGYSPDQTTVAKNIKSAYNHKGLKNVKSKPQYVAFETKGDVKVLTPAQEANRDAFIKRTANKRVAIEEPSIETPTITKKCFNKKKDLIGHEVIFKQPTVNKPELKKKN